MCPNVFIVSIQMSKKDREIGNSNGILRYLFVAVLI